MVLMDASCGTEGERLGHDGKVKEGHNVVGRQERLWAVVW